MLLAGSACLGALPAQAQTPPAWSADLNEIRHVAAMIPGARPLRINVLKFAESRRTKNFSVKGAAKEPSIQARTAFQLVYRDGTVMVDSGMDLQVHNSSAAASRSPIFRNRRAKWNGSAQRQGHRDDDEHGDHVGGVIRSRSSPNWRRKRC